MDRTAPVGRGFPPSSNKRSDASNSFTSCATAAVLQPLILKEFSWSNVCLVLIFATTYLRTISAQDNFSLPGTTYNCSSNIICLGSAHVYPGIWNDSRIQVGRLSLVSEPSSESTEGIAYYNQPVKLLDKSTRQSASFNTTFTIDIKWGIYNGSSYPGDGMAFVISADNSGPGASGAYLGYFDQDGTTTFKSIVVEFDTYWNPGSPFDDISDNHVSFDFMNITYKAAANASNVNVNLGDENTVYAWVEYSNETKQLEVRVSHSDRRPVSSLLSYTVDLFDVVEEYMWVGFSSGTGLLSSNFYIGKWTFESDGIVAPSPAPRPSDPVPMASSSVPAGGKSGGSKLAIIVGVSVGIPFLLAGIVIACYVWKRSGGKDQLGWATSIEDDPMMHLGGMPKRFSYKQLSVATKAFSEDSKLGQGGFGSVFRGVLPSAGIPVAVKKISGNSTQGEKEFMTEVSIISQLRHRNLIQLLGWCTDRSKEKYLLVYELMPNGSLDKALFIPPESQTACLSWEQRFNIVTGTAAALDYLHQGWKQQVIHRDIKSSNIMLDEEWNAKLGDFGLARLVDHQREVATTLMAGTYGYIAPEVAASGKFTDKTDVFAFGAVVLEVACGRKALSAHVPEDEMILVNWVWHRLSVGDLMSVVDKRLEEYDSFRMEVMLKVGLLCSHPNPSARPPMRHVVQVLAGDVPVPLIPADKPASEISSDRQSNYLHGSKYGSTSQSRSEPMSQLSTNTSDATQGSTVKSFETSSNSNSSFREHTPR